MLRAMRISLKMLTLLLALVGAFSTISFAAKISAERKPPVLNTPDAVHLYNSPNGAYRAQHIIRAGGGGISPYCIDTINVSPETVDIKTALQDKNYEVYSGQCDFFKDHSSSPKIIWLSDTLLQISFSINSTAAFERNVSLKKMDASKVVKVQYLIGE